jgi:H+/Cl- antiporter ClcA
VTARPISSFGPIAGLVAGAAGWFIDQRVSADILQPDCRWGGPLVTTLTGVLCLVLIGAGALWSWQAWRRQEPPEPKAENRRFLALTSVMAAGLFAVAVLFSIAAGLSIPACVR